MSAQDQINAIAASAGVDAGAVRWLADYIIRQAPEGHEDLLTDSDWIAACVEDWRKMQKHMAADALRKPEQASRVVLDQVRG